ncbi:unnamed protein product, partial [Brenthis ino]
MGIRLILLLGLLIGVLYCLHILAQDYQAISAPKLLRFLFKRDINSTGSKPTVRWKKILKYDPIQCARYLYCDLGARLPDNELRRGFIYMLTLGVKEEDKIAQEVFKTAYYEGKLYRSEYCAKTYWMCPFKASMLLDLVRYLLQKSDHENA